MDYDKSEIATIYDQARALTPDRSRQWRDVLSTHIDQRTVSVVVDLGCGTGRFTELSATQFGAKVIGMDPSRRMIDQAHRKPIIENIVFQQSSAESLSLKDALTISSSCPRSTII
jgi:ubiquinone/menaquinone biosynthesis C-methylase UbiE